MSEVSIDVDYDPMGTLPNPFESNQEEDRLDRTHAVYNEKPPEMQGHNGNYDPKWTPQLKSNQETHDKISAIVDKSEISTTRLGEDKKLEKEFIWAIKSGLSDEVRKLIQAGANVNQNITYLREYCRDFDDWYTCTAFEYAAEHGHSNIVKQLIQAGANIDKIALIRAAENGHADVVKELVQVIDVNYTNGLGETALMYAAKEFHLSAVNELIQAGADLNCKNEFGETALMIAIDHGLEFSSNPKTNSDWKWRKKVIQTLLSEKADVCLADRHGNTALILAVKKHDLDTVEKLLTVHETSWFGCGEKPINHADENGNTALIHAINSICYTYINDREYQRCFNSQTILEILIEDQDIDLNKVNKNGDTAITLIKNLIEKIP